VKAARIHSFGPPDVVLVEDVPMPSPGPGEVLVRVMAAGVAPWDAIIREGKSKVSPQPPLTLGSDFSGVVDKVGLGVTDFAPTEDVYGVTNPQFCGAQAEFAVATADILARKPQSLNAHPTSPARSSSRSGTRSSPNLRGSKPPRGLDAQDGLRSHLLQQLKQPASRFPSGCRQPRKLLASSSQAFAAAGQEATFVERLPEPDPGLVL
jgi:hypothetical protein